MRNTVIACFLVIGISLANAVPSAAFADQTAPVTVVFFKGLSYNAQTRLAAETFIAKSKVAPGSKLVAPELSAGAFASDEAAAKFIQNLGNTKYVLVAYSAGHKALWQSVKSMNEEQLKRVTSITSLEAEYSGFFDSVKRVKPVNPSVTVVKLKASQFGTNHSGMPGSEGVANVVQALSAAAVSDTNIDTSQFVQTQLSDPVRTALADPNRQNSAPDYTAPSAQSSISSTPYAPYGGLTQAQYAPLQLPSLAGTPSVPTTNAGNGASSVYTAPLSATSPLAGTQTSQARVTPTSAADSDLFTPTYQEIVAQRSSSPPPMAQPPRTTGATTLQESASDSRTSTTSPKTPPKSTPSTAITQTLMRVITEIQTIVTNLFTLLK